MPVDGGFELDGHGVFRHVLLATGHPGLSFPDELADDARVVHAYEPHDYAPRVAVVGAGMAAATEWLNALDAGRGGGLGPSPGAGATTAERRASALLEAWARRLPRRTRAPSGSSCSRGSASRPTRPAGPGTSRSSKPPPTVASPSRPS